MIFEPFPAAAVQLPSKFPRYGLQVHEVAETASSTLSVETPKVMTQNTSRVLDSEIGVSKWVITKTDTKFMQQHICFLQQRFLSSLFTLQS